MTQATKEELKHFTNLDTWSSAHWMDEDRFMDFVCAAYRNGDREISEEEFLDAFPELNKFLREKAEGFYVKYEQGISLLGRYTKKQSA